MLVVFAAFKKEAAGLLKLINCQKIKKMGETIIYDGEINSKRIIVCITGMGKSNSLNGVKKIIEMDLANPLFLIQGVSGALIENMKIGDLIIYESIQNLEQIQISKNKKNKNVNEKALLEQTTNTETAKAGNELNKIWGLSQNIKLTGNEINSYFNIFNWEEIETITEINNDDFSFLKNIEKNNIGNFNIFKSSGAIVSSVVTDLIDKKALNQLFGAEAVDMESYYIADIARNNGIPVACVRSVSDNLMEGVPDFFNDFESNNKNKYLKKIFILFKIIFSKSKIKSAYRTLKNINIASKNLNDFVAKIVLPSFDYKL
jgi:nucleoside phosphorylase